MQAVEKLVEAGEDPGKAIVAVLRERGTNVKAVAEQHDLVREDFSRVIHGQRVPRERELDALVHTLGGSRRRWLSSWFRWNERKALQQLAGR